MEEREGEREETVIQPSTQNSMDLYICTSVNEKIKKHFFSQSYKVDLGFVGAGILHNLGLHCDKRDKCLIYK